MSSPLPDTTAPLLWVDVETTGLEPEAGELVEVAVIPTTPDTLELLDLGETWVLHLSPSVIEKVEEPVRTMHRESGLWAASLASQQTRAEAEPEIANYCYKWLTQGEGGTLAGSSVHFDLRWMLHHLPKVAYLFHYRLLDVSALATAARLWRPDWYASRPKKKRPHRARQDLRESIEEARYYKACIAQWHQSPGYPPPSNY